MVRSNLTTVKDFCNDSTAVKQTDGNVTVTCQYLYTKSDCVNYKFILGSPNNVASVTTGNLNSLALLIIFILCK